MNNTTRQTTHTPPDSATAHPVAGRRLRAASPEHLTLGRVFDERAPLISAPAFFGPPVMFVLGPWLLLVLMLIGPFALIVTIVLAVAVAGAVLALLAAVIASPFLVIRHLHGHGTLHINPRVVAHPFRTHRVGHSRLGSPQPKGVS
ncbi:MAG TPA: hypothetical protein VGI87_14270 [Solirubrobacteraceae bacterium]|jgi:hypothetical protein